MSLTLNPFMNHMTPCSGQTTSLKGISVCSVPTVVESYIVWRGEWNGEGVDDVRYTEIHQSHQVVLGLVGLWGRMSLTGTLEKGVSVLRNLLCWDRNFLLEWIRHTLLSLVLVGLSSFSVVTRVTLTKKIVKGRNFKIDGSLSFLFLCVYCCLFPTGLKKARGEGKKMWR